jgi:hypothetical protein
MTRNNCINSNIKTNYNHPRMVRTVPDDIITAISSNLKAEASPVLRLTFKRGGLWQTRFAKAHSRKAKIEIREQLRQEAMGEDEKEWPLLIRLRENGKGEEGEKTVKRLNCSAKLGRGVGFFESMLSVFRVNFFKKKGEAPQKEPKAPTKPNALSKNTLRRKQKTQRNQERRKKRQQIKRTKQQ